MGYTPRLDERKEGWYMRDNCWFLTFGAATKEFQVSIEELRQLLRDNKIETRHLINSYNYEPFTIYSLEDLKRLVPVGNLSDLERRAYQLSREILERDKHK